jgi:hypothetical protein
MLTIVYLVNKNANKPGFYNYKLEDFNVGFKNLITNVEELSPGTNMPIREP